MQVNPQILYYFFWFVYNSSCYLFLPLCRSFSVLCFHQGHHFCCPFYVMYTLYVRIVVVPSPFLSLLSFILYNVAFHHSLSFYSSLVTFLHHLSSTQLSNPSISFKHFVLQFLGPSYINIRIAIFCFFLSFFHMYSLAISKRVCRSRRCNNFLHPFLFVLLSK